MKYRIPFKSMVDGCVRIYVRLTDLQSSNRDFGLENGHFSPMITFTDNLAVFFALETPLSYLIYVCRLVRCSKSGDGEEGGRKGGWWWWKRNWPFMCVQTRPSPHTHTDTHPGNPNSLAWAWNRVTKKNNLYESSFVSKTHIPFTTKNLNLYLCLFSIDLPKKRTYKPINPILMQCHNAWSFLKKDHALWCG